MNKDIKGLCLFLGMIGLAYAAVLILAMLFTGVKILKSIGLMFKKFLLFDITYKFLNPKAIAKIRNELYFITFLNEKNIR